MKIETLAVHAGIADDTGAVMPAIQPSSTFKRGNNEGYVYSRIDNPNRRSLEQCLTLLEEGSETLAFSSGMAAVNAVFQSLNHGDHVIMADDTYFGVRELALQVFERWGLQCSLVDMTVPGAIKDAINTNTRLIWGETPSNPMLKIIDLAAVANIAQENDILFAVDATWSTPVLTKPLQLGADLVVHSSTKYLGGHSDLLGGAIVVKEPSPLLENLRQIQGVAGAVPSPFDCWLLMRGIRTLPYRMRGHCRNAAVLAEFLQMHKEVNNVYYPGLPTHPGHDVATRQMSDFGGMLSIVVNGGYEKAAHVCANTQIFAEATSLGGVESLIEHRAPVEGKFSTTPDNLIRISVGLEHIDDLIADLDRALSM